MLNLGAHDSLLVVAHSYDSNSFLIIVMRLFVYQFGYCFYPLGTEAASIRSGKRSFRYAGP